MAKAKVTFRKAPRKQEEYDPRKDMAYSAAPPDDRTIDPACAVKTAIIRHKFKAPHPLLFRPFPYPHWQNPSEEFEPGRRSAQEHGFSPWVVRVKCASYAGIEEKRKFTFILGRNKDELSDDPYTALYWTAFRCKENGTPFANDKPWKPEWAKLLKGGAMGGACLGKPGYKYFIQGAVYQNNDKVYHAQERRTQPLGLQEGDPLPIIQLSGAASHLLDLFNLTKDEWEGDSDENPSLPYLTGDPVGLVNAEGQLKGGWIIASFNKELNQLAVNDGENGEYPNSPYRLSTWDPTARVSRQERDAIPRPDYSLAKKIKLKGTTFSSTLTPEETELVKGSVSFWFPEGKEPGLLHFPSAEEKMEYIAEGFRTVPKLVRWGLCDRPELFTDAVEAILNARVAVQVAGGEDDDESTAADDDDDSNPKPKKKSKLAGVKPADDDDDDTPPSRGKRSAVDEDEDDDTPKRGKPVETEEDDEDETPPAKAGKGKPKPAVDDEEDDETPPAKAGKGKPKPEPDADEDDDVPPAKAGKGKKPVVDDEDDETPPVKTGKGKPKPEVDDEDDDETPPAKAGKGKKPVVEDDGDEDETPPAKPGKGKKPVAEEEDDEETPPAKKGKKPPVTDDEDDDVPPAKTGKGKSKPVVDDEDDQFEKSRKAASAVKMRTTPPDEEAPLPRKKPKPDDEEAPAKRRR